MKVATIQAYKIIAPRPEDVTGSINDGGLAGIIRPNNDVEPRLQLQLKRCGIRKAPEATGEYLGNIHATTQSCLIQVRPSGLEKTEDIGFTT